ncbi:MAG: tetratricopeptide repeat protein [Planctomycetota bacterium]
MEIGPYRIQEELARGGAGAVYRAQGPDGAPVALKLLTRVDSDHARARLLREVEAQSRLRHPHVVRLLAAGETHGQPWLAQELIEGESLDARLRRGPLQIAAAVRLVRQLANALSYVHGCGVLHRDLKPGNVLLRGEDALLTDFGLVFDEQSDESRLTATGAFQGTPGYWAPEQARGDKEQVGPWTDVYGLGAVLYACLTQRPPIDGATLAEIVTRTRYQRPTPPRELRREVPAWLSELCMRCLSVEPEERPASADEVARWLIVGEAPGQAGARGQALALGAALALAAAVGLGVWARGRGERPSLAGVAALGSVAAPEEPRDAAASAPEADVAALLREAREALEAARWDAARGVLEQARAAAPHEAEVYRLRGLLRTAEGALEAAHEDFERVLAARPERWDAWFERGRSFARLDRPAEALADCDRALELQPGVLEVLDFRATCHSMLGSYRLAIADYDRVLARLDEPRSRFNRGLCHAKLGEPEAALADFTRAIELDPGRVRPYLYRGNLHFERGDYALAAADYRRLTELRPDEPQGFELLGRSLVRLERSAATLEALDRAVALGARSATVYRDRAVSYARLQRYPEALEDFRRALEVDPREVSVFQNRGMLLVDLERYAEALEDFGRALELKPDYAHAYLERARCYADLGRGAEARADLERAEALEPRLAGRVATLRAALDAAKR